MPRIILRWLNISERQGLKSILCVPLRYNELINGVCYLHNPLAGGVFSDQEQQILEAFLPYAAIALENALLNRRASATPTAPPADRDPPAASDPRLTDILTHIQDHFSLFYRTMGDTPSNYRDHHTPQ